MAFPSSEPDLQHLPARERILLTAHDLFYRDGIRATGVDKLIAASKVTKVTFYRHFPSKADLIRAFLDFRHERWMTWFTDAIAQHRSAAEGLAVLLPVMEEWFRNPVYRGCAFINSVAELGEALPDVREISARHKQDMATAIMALLPDSEFRAALADAAAIAVDGAIIRAQMERQAPETALQGLGLLLRGLESGRV